jgi:transposase
MNTPAAPLTISDEDRRLLTTWSQAYTTPQHTAMQARAILLAAEGTANAQIAKEVGASRQSVIAWRQRYEAGGITALTTVAKGRGRRASIPAQTVAQIIHDTLHTTPPAATHWSCRTMAKLHGVSPATIQRIWDDHGLAPHRVKTFKLSRDKEFVKKLTDVVGVYLNPPDKAVVLCVDEKSQIQALDRSQPGLPMKKGRCGPMTHDYKRHGTTTLFAALDLLEGNVVGQCLGRHRHQEFLAFLRRLDREFPPDKDLHLILDNYGTHKHADVETWLAHHPRFTLHFTPTSSSWLNLVERWFAEITRKRIRRGVFHSVAELEAAINEYITHHNQEPKPFVWTATVEKIMAKIAKCHAVYETLH